MASRSTKARTAPATNAPRIVSRPKRDATATSPSRSATHARTRTSPVVSCCWSSASPSRGDRPACSSAQASSATTSAKQARSTTRVPVPVPARVEKNRDSSSTAPTSATEAATTTARPVGRAVCPASLSTGTTRPSDVADRVTASSRGLCTHPAAANNAPARTPSTRVIPKPARANRSGRPRRTVTSISRPARNSRNASPTTASTRRGRSASTHPRTAGPRTMPATISSTGPGTRSHGASPSRSGTPNATRATRKRFRNPTSGMAASQPVGLEEAEPDLADGGERGDRVPQLVERHAGGDRDRGAVQELLRVGAGERRAHDDAGVVVDDEHARSTARPALRGCAGDLARAVLDGPHPQPALRGLRGGETDGADLRVREGDAGDDIRAGPVTHVLPEDHVGCDPRLVLAHVRERGAPVAVTDGVQPVAVGLDRAQPVVDLDEAASGQPDRLEAEVAGGRPASRGY